MRFEHPELLWLTLALPVATWLFLWWTGRTRRQLLTQFIQARLLPELTVGESDRRTQGRAMLLGTAAALLGLVLARPQWGSSWQEATQKGLDIVVAIDTSKSMLAEDIRPNRLARAKLAALDLMQLAQADRLGLIAFAGGAFLQCPLTLDDGVFNQCVNDLNVNIIPQGGTAVAEAIRTATRALQDNQNFQVLVLFSDGEDHDPDAVAAAREAAEAGLRIYTIGLGTPEGELLRIPDAQGKTDFVRDQDGAVVKSRLNEALLKEIAGAAQGFYLPLRGADTMDVLYQQGLAPLPKSESEARLYRHYHERYHWPLGLALVLIVIEILWPRRPGARQHQRAAGVSPADPSLGSPKTSAVAAAAVLTLSLILPAHASPSSAQREFESGNFATAREEYDRLREKDPGDPRLHFNAGAAAYRAGQFDAALERFNTATAAPDLGLQQQAYYNRGNAHYRVGEQQQDSAAKRQSWEEAIADYDAALTLNTNNTEALFNREFVKRRIEELDQQQQQQQDQNNQDNQEQQDNPTRTSSSRTSSHSKTISNSSRTRRRTGSSRIPNRSRTKTRTAKARTSRNNRTTSPGRNSRTKPRRTGRINSRIRPTSSLPVTRTRSSPVSKPNRANRGNPA